MCLYNKLIKNPKYKETKKNGGVIPAIRDKRVMAVPIGCQRCAECLKKKANEWRVRLFEEVKENTNGQFVTLTLSDESYKELAENFTTTGYELDNNIATLAVRRFLERWRKKHKKSVRHWLITELGHKGTENIHLHGIIWTDEEPSEIEKHWQYGYIWAGYDNKRTYVNNKTINYITKYLIKKDEKHQYYIPKILTSKGIGSGFVKGINARHAKVKEYYTTPSGHKMSLPTYYRNKLYSEEERENLWIEKLDKRKRYVDGIEIDIKNGEQDYINIRNATRAKYIQLGYNGEFDYNDKEYENQRRIMLNNKRINKTEDITTTTKNNDMRKYTNLDNW